MYQCIMYVKIPIWLKGKFYKTVVRSAMVYGSECWAVDKTIEQRIGIAKMSMLKWINGVISEDKIKNEYKRGSIGVASIIVKMRENKLRWLKYVLRREETGQ